MTQGFGGDMGSLLKQAQEMQRRVQEAERALAERVVEGSAGGGAVKVSLSGTLDVKAVAIRKDVVDPGEVDALEDLVTAAMRQAVRAALELKATEMAKVTGGMNLPGMGF